MVAAVILTAALASAQPAGERWSLMRHLQGTYYGSLLDDDKLRLYGWAEGSFTASSAERVQLPMGFNYLANDFLLQQNYVRFERPTDPKATEPTYGFRVDAILPGSDYRFTIARGLFDDQRGRYGFDPVQFYAEAYLPNVERGLLLRVGRFFAQFCAESIDTTLNPFVSRSYTFIYNPFTNTGLLAQLQLDDAWSVQSGLVLGSDVFIDPADTPTYIGSVKWAPPKGRATALFAVILSDPRYDVAQNFNRPQIFDFIHTYKPTERLTYTLEALYAYQTEVPGIGFANWYGVVNYLAWQLGPRLVANARLEFFDDVQGQRTGFEGLYTAMTAGLSFRPRPELTLRPEIRYDANDRSRPFDGRKELFTATMDVVVRW